MFVCWLYKKIQLIKRGKLKIHGQRGVLLALEPKEAVLEQFLVKLNCSTLQAFLLSRMQEAVKILSGGEAHEDVPAAPSQQLISWQ